MTLLLCIQSLPAFLFSWLQVPDKLRSLPSVLPQIHHQFSALPHESVISEYQGHWKEFFLHGTESASRTQHSIFRKHPYNCKSERFPSSPAGLPLCDRYAPPHIHTPQGFLPHLRVFPMRLHTDFSGYPHPRDRVISSPPPDESESHYPSIRENPESPAISDILPLSVSSLY